jgi:hypothetical protein
MKLFVEDYPAILVVFAIVNVVVGVWGGIVFLKCLGKVQQFSAWRALGNSVLATLVVLVPVGVIGSVAIYLTS